MGCLYSSSLTCYFDRADDLIPEESETVLLALKRLPPKEAYDRVFRLRRAIQVQNTSVTGFKESGRLIPISALLPINYCPRMSTQNLRRYVVSISLDRYVTYAFANLAHRICLKSPLILSVGRAIFNAHHQRNRGRAAGAR